MTLQNAARGSETVVAKRRGRPPRNGQPIENSSTEAKVAEILFKHCQIPGCSARWHIEDAKEVLREIKQL